MSSNTSTSTSGISFGGLLAIVFIVLKLCGVINWSWLWVLSPIWISIALVALVAIVFAIVWITIKCIETFENKHK